MKLAARPALADLLLVAALALVFVAVPAGRAQATPTRAPRQVAAVALPSRAPGAGALGARVRRVGAALAERRGALLVDGGGTRTGVADVAASLARAQELAATGALDEAARLLDDALEAGTRAPHRFADSDALLAAHVTRATIALARGELAQAQRVLERVLRWDPTFTLTAAEDSPRLRTALATARQRVGAQPALRAEDLGGLCDLDELLVARRLAPGRIEVVRLARCEPLAQAVVAELDETVLPLLDVAALPRADETGAARPLYKQGWFWITVGVVATAAAGVIVWQAYEPGESADVVPHL